MRPVFSLNVFSILCIFSSACSTSKNNEHEMISIPIEEVDSIIDTTPKSDIEQELIDLNFDGFPDIKLLDKEQSGTGGNYYEVFLYNAADSCSYISSEELSGFITELNPKEKTLTSYWKAGVSINQEKVVHFSSSGKITFTEITTREVKNLESKDILITSYTKKSNTAIIDSSADTTDIEGY